MASFKLTYFDARGRAELARYVFAAAGVKYEDERLEFEQWPARKGKTPYGQLPVLTVNGKEVLAESAAIARFIAKQHGLFGSTMLEEALCDQYTEVTSGIFNEYTTYYMEKDEAKKAEREKTLFNETMPKFMSYFEEDLKKKGGQFLVGTKLSLADLAIVNIFDSLIKNDPKVLDKYPTLKKHRDSVLATPAIKAYVASRKETQF